MTDLLNPFTDQQFKDLEQALVSADEIEAAIKKASRAGIEREGQLEEVRESRKKIRKILDTYSKPV